jgi:hypothetical protein
MAAQNSTSQILHPLGLSSQLIADDCDDFSRRGLYALPPRLAPIATPDW